MFSKAFLLCALVLAVTASDKIKKDVDDTAYDTTAYDSQTGSGPIWEKFRPTIGFTRDESGLQKTLSVPYNPFFQGIKVNVKPFTGGYVQIKANGAEIYKPLTSTATADPADTQEAEIIVDAQPDDEYYGNSLYRRSLYGDDIYTPYRVPVPAKYWRFPYYYPQVYQGQEYYPQNQYQNEYIYPEGDYQNYDRVVRSSTVTEGKKDKKTTTKDEKKDTQEEQINKFLYAYPRLSGLYSSIYRVPLYNGVQQQVGPVYGQDYNGVARQYYGGLYGRTQYPVSQKNYYDAINTPAYRQYQGNYFGEQYPYYRTAGQGYDVYNYLRQQPVY